MKSKILNWTAFGLLVAALILAFSFKNSINEVISGKMKFLTDIETKVTAKEMINSRFNYTKNGLEYEFTLLEFGTNACTICKKMQIELDKVKNLKPNTINVVFVNTTFPENQNLVTYLGISAVPMQVILDKNGNEIFKHYGFISAEDLILKTEKL